MSRPFEQRHIGPTEDEIQAMLGELGLESLDALIAQTIPEGIRRTDEMDLPAAMTEQAALERLAALVEKNQVKVSHIGMGYYGCHVPSVIRRNILENPAWYTSYTPYQAEVAQGRLEALLNFQTMVCDLTAMGICNASLLDEGTAAAEAMAMARCLRQGEKIFVVEGCHPQTVEVLRTRAMPLEIEVVEGSIEAMRGGGYFAIVIPYPATDGRILELEGMVERVHDVGALAVVICDLLALALIRPPGECGADIVVGTTQRFGVPMGCGGPHAAFLATRKEFIRRLPGRLVGVSRDAEGRLALRLTLQTREQHIRREKATSNICTAQVLLAVMASMYAVYHGPEGIRRIAEDVHKKTARLAEALCKGGHEVRWRVFFDTIRVCPRGLDVGEVVRRAQALGLNLRNFGDGTLGISLDETTVDVAGLAEIFGVDAEEIPKEPGEVIPLRLRRRSEILQNPVFRKYHTETELLRYIKRLEAKDISLANSMIPLGSCTMKLNATSEMLPLSWPKVSELHPFAPEDQLVGMKLLADELSSWLAEITGLPAVSLQPNAGAMGEYAGLMAIRCYHHSRGEKQRDICLIPTSAHGTNPASAVMAGFRVVAVKCLKDGDVDLEDLREKVAEHGNTLGALMITYPSTHGVFEEGIVEMCRIVHEAGGQVYMDGANMNAQVGLTSPALIGADVCHLNLHKTFCIPHGGGGPGVGPICAAQHLAEFLPSHPLGVERRRWPGPVASAPLGSASLLVIPWMYIAMMGARGLRRASEVAILNANYIAARLDSSFPVLYRGKMGFIGHECIIDVREWKERAGIEVDDIAKRLMDFGYHAPTMSWPVPGTLMIEPTESESKAELDRFCEAMLAIRQELEDVATGRLDRKDNPLKNAPHTLRSVTSENWNHCYSREQAAFPLSWVEERKVWPSVARVDNVHGDRSVVCQCPTVEELAGSA